MICKKCEVRFLVTHTIQATPDSQTRELKCPSCGQRATSVSFLVADRSSEGGAKQMANKIKKGQVRYATKEE